MSVFSLVRYFLIFLVLVSVRAPGVNSYASTDDSSTASDTAATTTDDGGTTTITLATTLAGVIYQAITVKKKPKDPSIKCTSLTSKPTATNLNFDNAQFGNVKFQ